MGLLEELDQPRSTPRIQSWSASCWRGHRKRVVARGSPIVFAVVGTAMPPVGAFAGPVRL